MKLVLAANWYGKSPWWSSLSFIFFWGGGWPKIYFGREQAQEQNSDALQRRGGIYNHLQAYLGANKHTLKSLKVTSAAPHPHLGRAFQTQGQSPANVDTCPERILRMAGENWQTGFTTAKCGSSRLNQSKQPFPTKGIFPSQFCSLGGSLPCFQYSTATLPSSRIIPNNTPSTHYSRLNLR